jgi:oligopeptide/dipeptide ABC transporter ATP-binding protein
MIGTVARPGRPVVEVEQLVVQFRARRSVKDVVSGQPAPMVTAVDGLSLTLAAGELLALVGESGCGKTTTVSAILGLQPIRSGRIRLLGVNLLRSSARELRRLRRRAQMVFQDPYESLDPRQRVREIVAEPLLIHQVGKSRTERMDMVRLALQRVDLAPADAYIDRFPHELSGGQRQRVAIAAALVLNPEILITDEPVSMLDVSARAGILNLLDRLRNEGLALLMITHDLSTAATYADRIAVMYLGRIVEEGRAASVINNPLHPYTQALVAAVPSRIPNRPPRFALASGEVSDPAHIPTGCRFHPRCPIAIDMCSHHDPELRPVLGHQVACHLADIPPARMGDVSRNGTHLADPQ